MSARQLMLPASRAFNSNGVPVAGAKAFLYLSGGTTPANFYSDSALTVPLGSSITANAIGRFTPTPYQDDATAFRLIIQTPAGVELSDEDPFYFGQSVVTLDALYPAAVGTFAVCSTLTVPTGVDIIATTGYSAAEKGGALYVYDAAIDAAYVAANPRSSFLSDNGRGFRLSHDQTAFVPQMFGAVADGVTDDSAAFVAAIAFLKAFSLNTGGGGFYKGSPKLFIPAGNYYLGTTTLDINHTLIIEGEGSGQFGPAGGGCTHLRWAAATDGIRTQYPLTSGNTTVQTDPNTHDGSGGVVLRDLCLEGGFAATESDHHGLVIRCAVKAERLYIKNFPGEGVKCWAGNINDNGALSGNVSTTLLFAVKCEGNRGGFDIRGSDANLVTLINCEGYQNRWFGYLDDNGAGSNTNIAMHCASNGVVTGAWPQTQCSSGGNFYAAKWGGDPTIAPSGDTTDTANWFYVGAGAPIVNLVPAWVSTANTFRAGGDYLTINSASTLLVSPYSEGGGFSQFNGQTLIQNPTMVIAQHRGGCVVQAVNDGLQVQIPSSNPLWLQTKGGETGVWVRDEFGIPFGYIDWVKNGPVLINSHTGCAIRIDGSTVATIDASGMTGVASVASTGAIKSSSTSGGVGYATGAGSAVTQLTNKSTASPAINRPCGQVTMNNAALGAGAKVSFVISNSTVSATDTILVSVASGGTANAYRAAVTAISAGVGFTVTVENITAGSLSESPVINFAILKAVAA